MGTIFKHANGTFYLKQKIGGKEVRRSLRTKDKSVAREFKSRIEKAFLSDVYAPKEPDSQHYTIEEAMNKLQGLVTRAPTTTNNYETGWKQFTTFLRSIGVIYMDAVRAADIAAWQQSQLQAGSKPTTVNAHLTWCSTLWKQMFHYGIAPERNPFLPVKALPTGPKRIRYLEWPIIEQWLAACWSTSPEIYLFSVLCGYGGMRRGEALDARWEDIDWERHIMRVRGTKTEFCAANIPLHPTFADALRPFKKESGHICACGYRHYWKVLREKTGIDITPHTLRHSVATHLLDLGYSLAEIGRFLRHGSASSTKIYADLRGVTVTLPRF